MDRTLSHPFIRHENSRFPFADRFHLCSSCSVDVVGTDIPEPDHRWLPSKQVPPFHGTSIDLSSRRCSIPLDFYRPIQRALGWILLLISDANFCCTKNR
ncbi:unnamed protein product [Victoria cruziana]